jgi:hypothetical protein
MTNVSIKSVVGDLDVMAVLAFPPRVGETIWIGKIAYAVMEVIHRIESGDDGAFGKLEVWVDKK